MAKVRVKELASQMGISSKDLIFKLQSLGVQVEDENASIDHNVIVAILSGKKVAPRRPRAVIMRDERPEQEKQEKKARLVKPPRPIVSPPKRERKPKTAGEEAPADTSQGPVIQEFVEAAEAEAKEQERLAAEAKKREAEEKEAAAERAKKAAEKEKEKEKAEAASAPRKPAEKKKGPTGPRARMVNSPRPDYGDQRRRRPVRSTRPSQAPEPEMPTPSQPAARRRRSDVEEKDRVERKKHVAKRRRATAMDRERQELLHKGPFSASAVLDDEEAPIKPPSDEEAQRESARRDKRKQAAPVSGKVLEFKRPEAPITLTEGTTVKDLADKLDVKANDLIKHLMMKKGRMLTINAPLEPELAIEIAKDLGIEAEVVSYEESLELEEMEKEVEEEEAGTEPRAPVITVMGHVDHGKTSLLDSIREAQVAEGEAGGITQHIGAYEVEKNGEKIVFLDTPGHEAFTLMRARGAKATDIVILVVAADDGVMPQTREAIDHAQAAGVPMIVAINKIDKANANPDKVRQELSSAGVLVEQWGGDVVSVEVSAVKGTGIDDLLEMILLQAEILELKATSDRAARGVVLEAKKEVGRGNVATVLVQDGSLEVGDTFISGVTTGKVKAMMNDRGQRVKKIGPATPVEIMGFDELPEAGDSFVVVDEKAEAETIAELRQEKAKREATAKTGTKMSLDQLFSKMEEGELKELNLIVKADVQGSVEVLRDTLQKLATKKVEVNVIHASVGAISTNDVLLASASEAIIIGFNVRPEKNATELAKQEEVEIRLHTVIYELLDEIKQAMAGLLEPVSEEVFRGRAEVRETFKVPRAGTVAGSYVVDGVIPRNAQARLLRDNRVIHEGKIGSLRRFKDDVSEVREGMECGISLERFNDVKIGDVIEAFIVEQKAAVLE